MGKQTTKERNSQIGTLYESGESIAMIAAQFNLSEGTVRNIVFGLGASRKVATKDKHDQIVKLVEMGVKKVEVAKMFNVCPSAVSNIIARRGQEEKQA